MSKILVLGAGGFGISLAVMFNKYQHKVTVWSFFESEIEQIAKDCEHKKLLPGVEISKEISLTSRLPVEQRFDYIIVAVPSFAVAELIAKIEPIIDRNTTIISVVKGFDPKTLSTMTDVIEDVVHSGNVVALSGPSHAEEVARGCPTTVVCACKNQQVAHSVQKDLSNENFRIYISDDVVGVEVGGALKNIIALACGMVDGLSLGDNTKAALMTRGMAEISRLGTALGGNAHTFAGLSGFGDLIVTCMSMHSRNRRAGILIGQGLSPKEALEKVAMTVEGYYATKYAFEIADKYSVDMPITKQAFSVLFENKPCKKAVLDLMSRDSKPESSGCWACD